MNLPVRTIAIVLTIASAAVAANTSVRKRLTPRRIAELNGSAEATPVRHYTVEVFGLTMPSPASGQIDKKNPESNAPVRVVFPAGNPRAILEMIREFRFPTEFDPPMAANDGSTITAPVRPTAFDLVNTGWTIHVSAKPSGKLIAVSGKADYVEAEMMNGGYGAVAGPIYGEKGELISPNVMHQPKVKTTSTSFYLFAIPGEPYEITLYRGDKGEKHTIKVTVD